MYGICADIVPISAVLYYILCFAEVPVSIATWYLEHITNLNERSDRIEAMDISD